MSDKIPQTVLTDQDAAMSKALATQWPETYHRLCIWHIYQNAATHLSNVFARFPSFLKDFKSCIYDYDEEGNFLKAWDEMLEKYGLQTNEWLKRLFTIREKWALVYGRQSFCADMTTTQRSESMHSVLKKYVNYKNNLLQFFNHFDRLISDRRYEEMKADLRTSRSIPVATFPVQILKHASSIYTHEVFELFQNELHKAYDTKVDLCGETEETSEYKITLFGKSYSHKVIFHSSQDKISCSCKKFEFGGILCSHVLKIFSLRNIMKIPELYVKKRWTKRAKKDIVDSYDLVATGRRVEVSNEDEEKKLIALRYKELCSLSNILTTRVAFTAKTFGITKEGLLRLIEEIDASSDSPNSVSLGIKIVAKNASGSEVCDIALDEDVQASGEITVKGLKKKEKKSVKSGKRVKSVLEKTRRKKKQNKTTVQIENDNKECEVGGKKSSMFYSTPGSSSSYLEPSQYSQIQFDIDLSHSRVDHQSKMSMVELLQQQVIKPQGFGGPYPNNYNPKDGHGNTITEFDDALRG